MAGQFICKVCPASYSNVIDLDNHLKIHENQSTTENIQNKENDSDNWPNHLV